jgi:hypothetical protein
LRWDLVSRPLCSKVRCLEEKRANGLKLKGLEHGVCLAAALEPDL